MPTHNPQAPFINRRGQLIGEPVIATSSSAPMQAAIQTLKDFRYQHLVMKHTGAPDASKSLSASPNEQGRYHFALHEPARPDAATDPLRQYAIQLLPWNLATTAPGGIPAVETRYIWWYPDFAAAPGVFNVVMAEDYSCSTSSVWGDVIAQSGVRTFTEGCTANPNGAWRHVMIATQNWLPAHLGVYEVPHDELTNEQVLVASGSVTQGQTIRGARALYADHSWGSLFSLAGDNSADGPEWAGRRCLWSFVHGRGLWIDMASGLLWTELWRGDVVPRDLTLPGAVACDIMPVWFLTATIAGMEIRWTSTTLGTTYTYVTTGLEAETMVVGVPFLVGHPAGDTVVCDYRNPTLDRGELTIHAAYLWEETQ